MTVPLAAGDFVPVKDKNLFERQYKSKALEIKTLDADFVQEKEISLISNKLISKGKMIYRNDNRLKIEYFAPNTFVFAVNNNRCEIKDRSGKSTVANNKLLEQVSKITTNAINGEILESKDFVCEILENDDLYLIKLVPKTKELKKYYKNFALYIAKDTFLIAKSTTDEISGDKTVTYFKNIKINGQISDEAFVVD